MQQKTSQKEDPMQFYPQNMMMAQMPQMMPVGRMMPMATMAPTPFDPTPQPIMPIQQYQRYDPQAVLAHRQCLLQDHRYDPQMVPQQVQGVLCQDRQQLYYGPGDVGRPII
jgi:RecA-family ATPase